MLHQNRFFAIIVDETTDLSVHEQVSLCIRKSFEIREDFLGFDQTDRTDAETLLSLVKRCLLQLGLDFENIRGQTYDGADNMRGNHKALFTYCVGHQLDLVCQDATRVLPEVVHTMEEIGAINTFIRHSAKRHASLEKLVALDSVMPGTHSRPLCETRWVLRAPSLKAFVDLYSVLMDWFEDMLHDSNQNANMRSKALGHLHNMERIQFFFLAQILLRIFETVHPVRVKVQGRQVTIGETKKEIETLVDQGRVQVLLKVHKYNYLYSSNIQVQYKYKYR